MPAPGPSRGRSWSCVRALSLLEGCGVGLQPDHDGTRRHWLPGRRNLDGRPAVRCGTPLTFEGRGRTMRRMEIPMRTRRLSLTVASVIGLLALPVGAVSGAEVDDRIATRASPTAWRSSSTASPTGRMPSRCRAGSTCASCCPRRSSRHAHPARERRARAALPDRSAHRPARDRVAERHDDGAARHLPRVPDGRRELAPDVRHVARRRHRHDRRPRLPGRDHGREPAPRGRRHAAGRRRRGHQQRSDGGCDGRAQRQPAARGLRRTGRLRGADRAGQHPARLRHRDHDAPKRATRST